MLLSRAVCVAGVVMGLLVAGEVASAQSFSQRDRLFLLYNQYNNNKNQQRLGQQQQQMSRQLQQLGQQPYSYPSGYGYRDPVEGYVQQVEQGNTRAGVPQSIPYQGGYRNGGQGMNRMMPYGYRRAAGFQTQVRYFNPVR